MAKKILISVLETESVVDSKINVIFGDDKLLNSLKIEFFNYDHLTDVIAFRINDYNKPEIEGEIYISLARAIENAKKYPKEKIPILLIKKKQKKKTTLQKK